MQSRFLVLLLPLLVCTTCLSAEKGPSLKIAVFDQRATGGKGASVEGLIRGLNRQGYKAEPIEDMQMLTLVQYDILYLSDMHHPGQVHKDWRKTLTAFVKSGGSVLQTWHHHILGEVGTGVLRIYGSRGMHIQPGHPAVAGVPDFDSRYKDHIIERVGSAGTVLIKNDAGQPVAVAGKIGKGKVISTGLALAIPNGRASRPPRGAELKLLKSFLAWLTPDIPRSERHAGVLKEPQLLVAPTSVLTAAGFHATFRVRVASPEPGEASVTCDAGEVKRTGTVSLPEGIRGVLSVFEILIPTEAGKSSHRDYIVRATVAGKTLEEKVEVTAAHGEAPANERRGVWLHVGMDRHPKVVMPELKKLGINMVVLRIAGGTAAFYASKVQPDIQDPLAPDGDWLAETVRHAHANGIEIHPYVNNCVVEGRTSKESLARLRSEGRLQQGPNGQPIDWFCPSQDVNFDAMERPMVEIATRYDVDGVQYDFIRYPNAQGCFCAKCRARFEKETGKTVANWPKDVLDGPRKAEWIEYRCSRISALVERISTRIHKEAPKVKISAAVFSKWPSCRDGNGQDWVRWCKEGWLDLVCPMNYTLNPKLFAERAAVHRKVVPKGFPIVQGIGIRSGQGAMRAPGDVAVQIALARQHGASGFLGFCYTPKHTVALFEPLQDWLK